MPPIKKPLESHPGSLPSRLGIARVPLGLSSLEVRRSYKPSSSMGPKMRYKKPLSSIALLDFLLHQKNVNAPSIFQTKNETSHHPPPLSSPPNSPSARPPTPLRAPLPLPQSQPAAGPREPGEPRRKRF